MKVNKKRKKLSIDKYNLGSFVEKNQQAIAGVGNYIGQAVGDNGAGDFLGGASSGFATGAALGSIVPGIGTAIGGIGGAIVGGISGIFGGGSRRRKQRELKKREDQIQLNNYANQYASNVDTINENPYGVYENGGDVKLAYNPNLAELDSKFQNWYNKNTPEGKNNIPFSTDGDYDYYSFYKNGDYKSYKEGNHFPDTYKRPNHETFSNESIYSTPENPGGYWDKDVFKMNGKFKYAVGGQVDSPLTQINIELGELQIDPNTGKILREYTGINPETGGKYEPHKPGNKKDTDHNFVNAEEDTFIITKAKAKDYKDAIKNNDKLQQNAILQNIRNKKRSEYKFRTGGDIDGVEYAKMSVPKFNTGITGLKGLPLGNSNNVTGSPTIDTPQASTSIPGTILDYAPGIFNIIQGNRAPNYIEPVRRPVNAYRNQTLANMPKTINYNPLFNRLYQDRNAAFTAIDETTSSPAVARANKINLSANTRRGVEDIYFRGEEANNNILAQRSNMYNQLGQEDIQTQMQTDRVNMNIGLQNRQMDEGRREQVNYGLSQLQQMYQNRKMIKGQERNDLIRQRILSQIFPAISPYLNNIYGENYNG